MPGRTVPLEVALLGNVKDLEASLIRAGIVAEDSSKKIAGSAAMAGRAAAEQARAMGASADVQQEAAARAAVAFTEAASKMTTAQKVAGEAASNAARMVGASLDEQRAAYARAVASTAEYEAATKRAAEESAAAAKASADAVVAQSAREAKARKAAAAEAKAHAASFAALGGKVLKAGALGGTLGVVAAVKSAMTYQTALASVAANSDISAAAANRLGMAFLGTAGRTIFSAGQMASAYASVAGQLKITEGRALSEADALRVMDAAGNLAEATQTSLATSTSALSVVMQAYHMSVGQAAGASDMLFNVSRAMNVPIEAVASGVDKLHGRLGVLAPTLADTSALMIELGQHGITGTRGVTVVNTALQTLVGGSAKVKQTLADLGVNIFDSSGRFIGLQGVIQQLQPKLAGLTEQSQLLAVKTLFGSGAAQVMNQIVAGGVPKFQQATDAAAKLGTAHDAATKQDKTLRAELETIKATVSDLATRFGLFLIPRLEAVGRAVQSVIGWFDKHKAAAEILAATITTVLGAAIAAFVYTRATAFLGAVGGMAKGMTQAAVSIAAKMGLIDASATTMATTVSTAGDEVVVAADTTAAGVDTALGSTGVGLILIGLGVGVTELATHWQQAMDGITSAAKFMYTVVRDYLQPLIFAINQISSGLNTITGGLVAGGQFNLPTANQVFGGGGGGGGKGNALSRALTQGMASIKNPSAQGITTGHFTTSSFAAAVLARLGAPETPRNLDALVGWIQREGNNPKIDKYNPLDTTLPEKGSFPTNSAGVQSFKNWASGLMATVATLEQQNMGAILASLKAGHGLSGPGVAAALSAWSGGGYSSTPMAHLGTGQLAQAKGAAATATIPAAVTTMLATAQALIGASYTWGGGHGGWDPVAVLKKIGVDCSGFVSQVLHAGGVQLPGPQTTEGLASNLQKGRGRFVTVWDRSTGAQDQQHTLIDILGKWFESGGRASPQGVSQITSRQAAQELAGGGFQAYNPGKLGGPNATAQQLRALGISSSAANAIGNGAASLQAMVQSIQQALINAGNSLILKLTNAIQSGTVKTLSAALGATTGGKTALGLSRIVGRLGDSATLSQVASTGKGSITAALTKGVAGSAQGKSYQREVVSLIAAGQMREAQALVAAHKAAMAALAQELYAAQLTKDAESLKLQATQLNDMTRLNGEVSAATLTTLKAEQQTINDANASMVQSMRDAQKTIDDQMAGIAQAIKDAATINTDQSNLIVTGINDSTQTAVDRLGERGLYGLNLVAQKLQVQLDETKAYWDKQLATDQLQLDQLQAQANAAENAALINVDQVTAQENLLVAAALANQDQVTAVQDARIAAATAHADAVQSHVDATLIGPAQMAVDLNATAPKAVQDVFGAQLAKATARGGSQTAIANAALGGTTDSANAAIQAATSLYNNANNAAQVAIQGATNSLQSIIDYFNTAIAQSGAKLSGDQASAAQAEATLQGQVSITTAASQTQYAGTGLVVNQYMMPPENASANAEALGWTLRTLMPA